jgi:hypothetical protein
MIQALAGNNITVTGKMKMGTIGFGSTSYGFRTQFTADSYRFAYSTVGTDWTTGDPLNITSSNFYYSNGGKVAYTHAPDEMNECEVVLTTDWDKSVYVNSIGALTASEFALDEEYTGAGYKFKVSDDTLNDTVNKAALDRVYEGYVGSQAGQFGGTTITDMSFYTDGKGAIVGFGAEYKELNAAMTAAFGMDIVMFTSFYVTFSDIGTTTLDKAQYVNVPYTIDTKEKDRYDAFSTALTKFATPNYAWEIKVDTSTGTTLQSSKALVTADGWSGYDSYPTGIGTAAYYGVHKKTDGKFDYYRGTAADKLAGDHAAYAATATLPTYQLSPAIFDVDYVDSTTTDYVFTMKEDFIKNSYGPYAAGKALSVDSYASSGTYFKVTIDIATQTMKKIETDVDVNSDNKGCTFTQTFSDFGAVTAIPTDVADFTAYTAFTVPAAWADVTATTDAKTYQKATDVLPTLFTAAVVTEIEKIFPIVGGLENYYLGAGYAKQGTDSDGNATAPTFDFALVQETRYDDAVALYKTVLAEMTALGYKLIPSDTQYDAKASLVDGNASTVEVTISSNYIVYIVYTGVVTEG